MLYYKNNNIGDDVRIPMVLKITRGLSLLGLLAAFIPFVSALPAGEPQKDIDPDQFQIQEDEWELLNYQDGIETYRMRHKGTEVQTFKGVAFVDARIEVVGEVLRDIPNYPNWMYKFKDTKILKEIDRNTYVFWSGVSTPFPYKNRDIVVENETRYNFDNGTAELDFWAAKQFQYPKQSSYLRVGLLEGTYLLEYFGRDKTRVSYQYRSDPGGNIPLAIANWIEIRHFPYHTLKGLQKVVQEEKYIEAGKKSPEYSLIENMLNDRSKVETILRNRLLEYISDRYLIDSIFSMPGADQVVDIVYDNRADFESIRTAMVSLFKLVSERMVGKIDQQPEIKESLESMLAHIQPKEFESFFNIEKFMQEGWLVGELTKNPELVQSLLQEDSELARALFEKITTSEAAVKAFISSKSLAYRILDNATVRQQLWEDKELRRKLGEEFVNFKTLKDFENLIKQRVNTY